MVRRYRERKAKMTDYIERNELIKNLKYFAPEHYSDLINNLIMKQPAADIEPVKHGHWITDSVEFYKLLNAKGVPLEEQPYLTSDCVACSECMRVINCMDNCMEDAMYCKYCGAKMDEENSE